MIDLVTIEGGRFLMGENPDDKFANDTERPRHKVNVPAFRLGRAPVTIAEFRRFRPDHERGLPGDWPAAMVSWDDAVAYCDWLGGGIRLPSVPTHRVLRGGAWDYLPRLLRVSWRDHLLQNQRRDNVGFRIASNL
jgi:formylglycine-generating enzyme required for sulfatase activity